MISGVRWLLAAAALAAGIGLTPLGKAVCAETTPGKSMKLGYVELADDPRYENRGAISGITFTDLGRPYLGSQVALKDAQAIGRVIKVQFSMEKATGASIDDLVKRVSDWVAAGDIHFVLADLAGGELKQLAHRLANRPVMLFNISAPDDLLRGADCAANVLHTYPSDAMLADALVQYLASKDWLQILVLQGPAPEDAGMVAALRRSAKKFRARIVDTKPFLSNQ